MTRHSSRQQWQEPSPAEEASSICAKINDYILRKRREDPTFHANTLGLKVLPQMTLEGLRTCYSFIGTSRRHDHIRIRYKPLRPNRSDAPVAAPLAELQVGEGRRWWPLRRWIDDRYGQRVFDADTGLLVNYYAWEAHLLELRKTNPDSWKHTLRADISMKAFQDGSFFSPRRLGLVSTIGSHAKVDGFGD